MLNKVRLLSASAAVALALAMPMTFVTSEIQAEPWYQVTGDYLEMRNRAHGEGKVICRIPKGQVLYRNHEQNWSRWIHAQWLIREGWEWDYKDYNGKWCAHWDRRGWIDKTHAVKSIRWPSWAY